MKTTISGIIAAFFSFMTVIATVPTDLQAMVMNMFPKSAQPWSALIFAVAAFIAKSYQSKNTADSVTPPKPTA